MDGLERWRVLRLHVEDQIPLAALARTTGVSARTLQRWLHLYRAGGIAALDPQARVDAGRRRTAPATVAFVERLALTRPRPSIATLHRLAAADAQQREDPIPSLMWNSSTRETFLERAGYGRQPKVWLLGTRITTQDVATDFDASISSRRDECNRVAVVLDAYRRL